jgi:hypothetical protein
MSRIFDVILEQSGMYSVLSTCGKSRFRTRKYGTRGQNQILLPTYANEDEEEVLTWSANVSSARKVDTNLDEVARESHDKQLMAHKLEHTSKDLQVVRSGLHQYVEANNMFSAVQQVMQLGPLPITNSNKAAYYLKLNATCSRMDFVEVQFGTGDMIEINGDFNLFARDKTILNLIVRMPSRSKFRTSYSQILPAKESILKLLSRVQYGKSPIQP